MAYSSSPVNNDKPGQAGKATAFRALHHQGTVLLLPNIWDAAGAVMLEQLGYPAVATASAAVSRSLGYEDGENIPFDQLCWLLNRIVSSVSIPVSADIECGFARNDSDLKKNILRLLETSIAGINIEDSLPGTKQMLTGEAQSNRIRLVRKTADEKGVPLFINARTDVFLRMTNASEDDKIHDVLSRAKEYIDAGADSIYPIGAKEAETIRVLVKGIPAPVNILAAPGVHDLKNLEAMGVARVSFGPKFHAFTLRVMKEMASELKGLEGLEKIS